MEEFWLDISPIKGEGNAVITNTVQSYTGREKRNTVVVAAAETVSAIDSYSVQQEPHSEYIIISRRVIDVQSSENIVTITGRSNARKITFATISGGEINFTIPNNYTANGYGAVNGQLIQDDPGKKIEYNFEFNVTVPRNVGYARSGEILVSGENSSTVVIINQSIYEITVFFTAGSFVTSVTPTSQKIEYYGNISCVATIPTSTAQYTYAFDAWYKDGVKFSTNPILEASNITSSGTYEAAAYRTLNSYTLTVTPSPILGGTVTGGGVYYHGTKATTTAVAASTYRFTKWVGSNGVESTLNPFTNGWNILDNINVTAVFNKITYQLILRNTSRFELDGAYVENTDGGTVTGAGVYDVNTVVTAIAIPKEGCQFEGWYNTNGVLLNANATFTINMTDLKIFVARFSQKWVNFKIIPHAINSDSGGQSWTNNYYGYDTLLEVVLGSYYNSINNPNGMNYKMPFGSTVKLTSTSDVSYEFNGYYDFVNELDFTFITLDNILVLNNYVEEKFICSRVKPDNVWIIDYIYDMIRTTPESGRVMGWAQKGGGISTFPFHAKNPEFSYPYQERISGDCGVTPYLQVFTVAYVNVTNIKSDCVIRLTASETDYKVTVEAGSYIEQVTPAGLNLVRYGSSITCTAMVKSQDEHYDYTFRSWQVGANGVLITTSENLEFTFTPTLNDEFYTIRADGYRQGRKYVITVINGTGNGTYWNTESVVITATPPDPSMEFYRWSDGNTESPRTIIVSGSDATYTAEFKTKVLRVACYSVNTSWSSISPVEQEIVYGGNGVVVTATPRTGYVIEKWVNAITGVTVSTSNTFTPMNVTEDAVYDVYAVLNEVLVQTSSFANEEDPLVGIQYFHDPLSGTSTVEPSMVTVGGSTVLTATPSEGYSFVEWYNAATNQVISTSPTYTMTNVTSESRVGARFQKKWFNVEWGYPNVWGAGRQPEVSYSMCMSETYSGSFVFAGFNTPVNGAYLWVTLTYNVWVPVPKVTSKVERIKRVGDYFFAFPGYGTDYVWVSTYNDPLNWRSITPQSGFTISDASFNGKYFFIGYSNRVAAGGVFSSTNLLGSFTSEFTENGIQFSDIAFDGRIFTITCFGSSFIYYSNSSVGDSWSRMLPEEGSFTHIFSISDLFVSFSGTEFYVSNYSNPPYFISAFTAPFNVSKILSTDTWSGAYGGGGLVHFDSVSFSVKSIASLYALTVFNDVLLGYTFFNNGKYGVSVGTLTSDMNPISGFLFPEGGSERVAYNNTTPIQTISAINSNFINPSWKLVEGDAVMNVLNNNLSMTLSNIKSDVYYAMGFTYID